MAETVDLSALIRLIPPARTLKNDLEASLHMELYIGTGDLAVKTYNNLHATVTKLTDDPYVKSLALEVPEDTSDKEKVSLVRFAAGQLVACLESQTGLVGVGSGSNSYYAAPVFNGSISDINNETLERIMGLVKNPITEDEGTEQGDDMEA